MLFERVPFPWTEGQLPRTSSGSWATAETFVVAVGFLEAADLGWKMEEETVDSTYSSSQVYLLF